MINELITGISGALYALTGFGTYTDFTKQAATFPCFYVALDESTQEQMLGDRYERRHRFFIHYFPSRDGEVQASMQEINGIRDALFMSLEYITLTDGSKVRGTDMDSRMADDVLVFRVSYDVFIRKEREGIPAMEVLTQKGGIKDGS